MKKRRAKNLLQLENEIYQTGVRLIAGIDEVGRGCLAGPLCAAAVILPPGCYLPEVDDSKKLSAKQRSRLYDEIVDAAVAWTVSFISHAKIDQLNIHRATLQAMQEAVSLLPVPAEYLLIDGRFTLPVTISQRAIVHGDARSQSIAAASIVAKVTRDRWMEKIAPQFPEFGFEKHKGYGTRMHWEALSRLGPTEIHRKSFIKRYYFLSLF